MRYTQEQIAAQSQLVTDALEELTEHQARLAHMLKQNAAPLKPGPKPALLNMYGKLTEYGTMVMFGMFAAGDRDSDIAAHFEITPSAVYARRQRWESAQRKKKALQSA
ncbi:hypothetical protein PAPPERLAPAPP_02690 [Brevundimonas phage vB_BpoS-Papperlapapp]|uniref:Uncharacterized protein n=2 Tax=Marchewkavirus TaxID=3425052 RepID=A0A9E7MQE4_9CAUD|nr:hypothetical protein KABACHOK_01060 [Brevundimonas phage vB_BpoS-Kabachok]USN14639.1 winged helix-turn-helix DNA-binding protein [Brevundimonas phage vB_BpoS-Domovoi]USN16010.1 hypothetical protein PAPPERLAPAPP_02690 [Brevundimonas phage vB_BpoS-Papperlapapp]